MIGIVLRARALGDADKIYTLLTAERGKVDVVAKGVRRARSAFSGRLEFMNEVGIEVYHGRSLDTLTAVELRVGRFEYIVEPRVFAVVARLAEYVDASCERDQPVPEIFALLQGVLDVLRRIDDPTRVLPRFSLRLLDLLGFGPQLHACVRCSREICDDEAVLFDVDDGGVVCARCRPAHDELLPLSSDDAENLRALIRPGGGKSPATMFASAASARIADRLLRVHIGIRSRVEGALESFESQ